MNIRSLLTAMAASFIFYSLMPLVTSASDHEGVMLEMKGNIMTELRRVGSPMLAVQLVDGANGEMVSRAFTYTASIFKDTVVDFAQVDVSDPENAEWRVPVGGATFFYVVPTGTDDFSIMALGDIPATPVEMAMFLELEYMDKIVYPALINDGGEATAQRHFNDLDKITSTLMEDSKKFDNDNNHGNDDSPDNKASTTDQAAPDNTLDIAEHYRRPFPEGDSPSSTSIPFMAGRKSSRQHRKQSLKVGEEMARPEVLTSHDGSTTLSLASCASIVIGRSHECPLPVEESPMMPSPPPPQCPVPTDVDGDGKANEDTGLSELLPANERTVRRMADTKAREEEERKRQKAKGDDRRVHKKGPLRSFLGFFGHGAIVEERDVAGSEENSGKGDGLEDGLSGSEDLATAAAAAAADGVDGGVPGEVKDRAASRNEGKKGMRAGGWFGWRNQVVRKAEVKMDGETSMAVSDIGGVEVTYDGVRVISKSGPHKWEWVNRVSRLPWGRQTSDEYELHVVNDGFEMHLGEEKVWGVSLPSDDRGPDGP